MLRDPRLRLEHPDPGIFERQTAGLLADVDDGADGRPLAPAGSSRDLFLHTRPESHGHVRATLQALLDGSAEVHSVADLIEQGVDLVVLPRAGEAVYWNEPPRFTQPYRGQHGGLAHAEMEIPLIAFVTVTGGCARRSA